MSLTVFKKQGYRFFFFSREESRKHIHVVSADGECKMWLEPRIELADNYHLSPRQLREVETIVEENRDELIRAWHSHFGQ
jgi:hypothetical protein